MDDNIKIYESLLNEKAALEKDCFHYELEYTREFGDSIVSLFELKVEAVTLKKKIAFCVKKRYRSQEIDASELGRYIDDEILEYQRKLQDLIAFNNEAKKGHSQPITFDESKKIKKLYYQIAHLIHPDLHQEYQNDDAMSELWDKAVAAYKCNHYKELVEIYDQILLKVQSGEATIENIEGKIETLKVEIEEIKANEPYQYKYILDDEMEIKAVHEELEKEIKDYQEYVASLQQELGRFSIVERHDA